MCDLSKRSVSRYLAVIDERDAIAEPLGLLQVVGRQHHARALAVDLLDVLPELQQAFVRAVLARAGTPLTLEYIRLNMVARRAGEEL